MFTISRGAKSAVLCHDLALDKSFMLALKGADAKQNTDSYIILKEETKRKSNNILMVGDWTTHRMTAVSGSSYKDTFHIQDRYAEHALFIAFSFVSKPKPFSFVVTR